MNLSRSRNRRWICLFLSTSLFMESGYSAAPGLSQMTINDAKSFLNSTGIGKSQTVGTWFEKAKSKLDADTIATMTPWVNNNKNKKMPSLSVMIKNSASKGKYLSLNFNFEGEKVEFELHEDKELYVTQGKKEYRENDLELSKLFPSRNIAQASNSKSPSPTTYKNFDPFLSYADFKKYAQKDPEWGIKYMKALRATLADMEEQQKTFFSKKKNKKSVSYFYDLAIPSAYAQNQDQDPIWNKDEFPDQAPPESKNTGNGEESSSKQRSSKSSNHSNAPETCIVAGWIGTYLPESGNCTTLKDKATKFNAIEMDFYNNYVKYDGCGKDQIDCNPAAYGVDIKNGKRWCVPLQPKQKVSSVECDNKIKITSPQALKDMMADVEKMYPDLDYFKYNALKPKWVDGIWKEHCFSPTQRKQFEDEEKQKTGSSSFTKMISEMRTAVENNTFKPGQFAQHFNANFPTDGDAGNHFKNHHDQLACETVFKRMAFLDGITEEKKKEDKGGGGAAIIPGKYCPPGSVETGCDPTAKPPGTGIVDDGKKATDPAPGSEGARMCPKEGQDGSTGCKLGIGLGIAALVVGMIALFRKRKKKTKVINNTIVKEGTPGAKGDKGDKGDPGTTTIIHVKPPPKPPPPDPEPPSGVEEPISPNNDPNRPDPSGSRPLSF